MRIDNSQPKQTFPNRLSTPAPFSSDAIADGDCEVEQDGQRPRKIDADDSQNAGDAAEDRTGGDDACKVDKPCQKSAHRTRQQLRKQNAFRSADQQRVSSRRPHLPCSRRGNEAESAPAFARKIANSTNSTVPKAIFAEYG